jgi:hypothetical protein
MSALARCLPFHSFLIPHSPLHPTMLIYQRILTCSIIFLSTVTSTLADTLVGKLDLVFPQPNATYTPVYPFPIVSSFVNLGSARAYPRILSWGLIADNYSVESEQFLTDGEPGDISSTIPTPAPYHYLSIIPIDSIRNLTLPHVGLSYSFRIGFCEDIGYNDIINYYSNYTEFQVAISFNIDPNGELPDIATGDDCAYPLGAIGLVDPLPPNPYQQEGCPKPENPAATPNSCATPINSTIQSQVVQAMLNDSHCNVLGRSWPNTSWVKDCPLRNGAEIYLHGMRYAIVPILELMLA